jgi:hypothetical protein
MRLTSMRDLTSRLSFCKIGCAALQKTIALLSLIGVEPARPQPDCATFSHLTGIAPKG